VQATERKAAMENENLNVTSLSTLYFRDNANLVPIL
jgi:hypothetical protein